METIWIAASYLAGLTQHRIRAIFGSKDTGALSLEWIVIAVLLVAAATVAGALFTGAINAEANKLP